MGYPEPRVVWPSLDRPIHIERDLVFVQGRANGTEGEKKFLTAVALEVLVNGSLYVVIREGHGLRKGQVLSRNMKLTEVGDGDRHDPSSHHFIRYDDVYNARRALGRLHGNYKRAEVPSLRGWSSQLNWMMEMSWTLHKAGEGDKNQFVWVAEQLIDQHGRVRDSNKVSAIGRTRKAGTKTDATGRVNTGMIPLLCSAANRSLTRRIQAVRGIGRRMDWRAVVLEAYIDQLREQSQVIGRAAKQRLASAHVFGDKRTKGSVERHANRMRSYAERLGQIHARPFSRAFMHVGAELLLGASSMSYAAETLDSDRMEESAAILRRIYRSMKMLEYHSRLEEILVLVAEAHHRGVEVEGRTLTLCIEELSRVHSLLTQNDSFTGESLEEGFRNSVLARVVSSMQLARLALLHGVADGESKTSVAYKNLKEACAPF